MTAFESLSACAGTWHGTNLLHDPHSGQPEESASILTITPVLGGRFLRISYTWGYRDEPQEGIILIGYQRQTAEVSAHWIDTWHMGEKVMACTGGFQGDGISVEGSYAAPPGPDWGWRISIRPSGDGLQLTMDNISPEGSADPAVEANYHDRA